MGSRAQRWAHTEKWKHSMALEIEKASSGSVMVDDESTTIMIGEMSEACVHCVCVCAIFFSMPGRSG